MTNTLLLGNKRCFKGNSQNTVNARANSDGSTIFAYEVIQNLMILGTTDFPNFVESPWNVPNARHVTFTDGYMNCSKSRRTYSDISTRNNLLHGSMLGLFL